MKLKQAILYRLSDAKNAIIIYYIVATAIMLFSHFLSLYFRSSATVSGTDISSFIFIFILGLNSFKPVLLLFTQNGISRQTMFLSLIPSALCLSLVIALLDHALSLLLSLFMNTSSFFSTLYSANLLQSILWSASTCFAFFCIGYFIASLYYRMNKLVKVLVSAGVPLFLFIVMPVLAVRFPSLGILHLIKDFMIHFAGINVITGTANPLQCSLSFAITALVALLLTYPLVHRVSLKEA